MINLHGDVVVTWLDLSLSNHKGLDGEKVGRLLVHRPKWANTVCVLYTCGTLFVLVFFKEKVVAHCSNSVRAFSATRLK